MRRILVFALVSALVGGSALAATSPDSSTPKPPSTSHAHQLRNARAKTTGNPLPSSPVDPDAGTSEQGTPNPTVTNGSELAH